ncbi:MAG: carboxypeptidase regulatory-like domain-containing protein, partial [Burkholderiales bacterium]
SGRLLDANGKPLASALIETLDGRADAAASVTTDADGRFVFTTLAPGASSSHLRYRVSHA